MPTPLLAPHSQTPARKIAVRLNNGPAVDSVDGALAEVPSCDDLVGAGGPVVPNARTHGYEAG